MAFMTIQITVGPIAINSLDDSERISPCRRVPHPDSSSGLDVEDFLLECYCGRDASEGLGSSFSSEDHCSSTVIVMVVSFEDEISSIEILTEPEKLMTREPTRTQTFNELSNLFQFNADIQLGTLLAAPTEDYIAEFEMGHING